MKTRNYILMGFGQLAAFAILGCGGGDSGSPSPKSEPTTTVPETAEASALCVISADCPAGTHCDLGECIQDCNEDHPCGAGKTCSERARCLAPSEKDQEPEPTAEYAGSISVEPKVALLTASDSKLVITLASASEDLVGYRVQLDAPHLSIEKRRGEFRGLTTLELAVDASTLKAQDVAGSVKIFTTLGNVSVSTPIHVGLTGRYRGSLEYEGGLVPLGSARLAVDLLETDGQVMVRFDPDRSVLFPETEQGPATGFGYYVPGESIELNASQVFEAGFGGERNHLLRDVGRRLRLQLEPTTSGNLEGTFEEKIFGLFGQPVTLSGRVHLIYEPHAGAPDFTLSQELAMPSAASLDRWEQGFGTWGNCASVLRGVCSDYSVAALTATKTRCFSSVKQRYADPLYAALAAGGNHADLAPACSDALAATGFNQANGCGLVAPLACALSESASAASEQTNAFMFGRLMQDTVAPALLVAQDHVVDALDASFLENGVNAELQQYNAAMDALDPIAGWVLQPTVLEFMRQLDLETARGDSPEEVTESQNDSFPSARALARLLTLLSTVDAERSRLAAANLVLTQPERVRQSQERAVLTYLQVAALVGILNTWGDAPPQVAAQFIGVLTPLDSGFDAALRGAAAFGVPEGYVPFVFNHKDTAQGSSNFAQMQAIAKEAVSSYVALEESYLANTRTFEQNEQDLREELLSLDANYDARIVQICGAAFDPDSVETQEDWSRCGKDHGGEVGALLLAVEGAQANLNSSESAIQGMKDKIAIDQKALEDKQGVHAETLRFIDNSGRKLEGLAFAEGMINATQAVVHAAQQSDLTNFGSPVALATVDAALELAKAGVNAARENVHTAQAMRYEEASASIELIDGMANIQKQLIDLAQLSVEMQQTVIGVHEAKARAANAVLQAQQLHNERARATVISELNPAHDPSFRVLRDRRSLQLLAARATAQSQLYLAARALEYDVNSPISGIAGAVLNARNQLSMDLLQSCFNQIHDNYRTVFGTEQSYSTTVSVREMLGIAGSRTDEVTGEELSAGEQFRHLLLRNENLDGRGGVGITFATELQPGNGLWSTDVCGDRITSVKAQLVGDFLGDNEAQVNLSLSGSAVMRDCGSETVQTWSLGTGAAGDAFAVIQAGVNTFGTAGPNTSLHGQSVARASWRLVIPGKDAAPPNADLDLTKLEDVVLQIEHEARPRYDRPLVVDVSCLGNVR